MNYEESDSFKEEIEANTRHRKMVMLSIVLCAVLIAFLFIMILMLNYIDMHTMKVSLDEKQVKVSEDFIKEVGQNDKYINLRELAKILGTDYVYTAGDYREYNENENSGYIQNNFEVVAFSADTDCFTKYIEVSKDKLTLAGFNIATINQNRYSEDFYIDKPVKAIGDELYASIDIIPDMFNLKVDWSNEFRLKFTSLERTIALAKNKMPPEYNTFNGYYENFRALTDGYLVFNDGKEKDSLNGVYNIKTKTMVFGAKYAQICYLQNVKQFLVTTENQVVGILNTDGSVVIPIEAYNSISLMDSREKLYLVEKEKQYGVINASSGKREEVAYCEYDKIGLDDVSKFPLDNITNKYLLFNECIPFYRETEEDGVYKYGLLDKKGEIVLSNEYDSLGFESYEKQIGATKARNTLLIPESVGIRGIIVRLGDSYGIYDVDKQKLILPTVFSKIYVAVKDGTPDYYIEFNEQTMLLKDFLIENGLVETSKKSVEPEKTNKTETNTVAENTNTVTTNTVENTVENTTTTANTVTNTQVDEVNTISDEINSTYANIVEDTNTVTTNTIY